MPSLPKSIPLDLDRFSEDTRRRLHDAIEVLHFLHPLNPDEDCLPYTAEAANFMVLWAWGRWIAVWKRLEVEGYRPEAECYEVLRIKESAETYPGIMLYEV